MNVPAKIPCSRCVCYFYISDGSHSQVVFIEHTGGIAQVSDELFTFFVRYKVFRVEGLGVLPALHADFIDWLGAVYIHGVIMLSGLVLMKQICYTYQNERANMRSSKNLSG